MTTADYPQDPAAVAQARSFIASTLGGAPDDLRDRAVLITSELATNAVLHARTPFRVTATIEDGELFISVTDHGGAIPLPRRPDPTEPHGRGLLIADALADRWGIDAQPHATTVWFTLALPQQMVLPPA